MEDAMTNDLRLPVSKTEVVRSIADLPAISAEQYQHVGRYAGAVVMHCFETIGGVQRMAAWADGSPESFFTKVFPKMISRSQQVDISATLSIDDAIERLERQNAIAVEFREVVEDAEFYDL
jgi:hypothetical protein